MKQKIHPQKYVKQEIASQQHLFPSFTQSNPGYFPKETTINVHVSVHVALDQQAN